LVSFELQKQIMSAAASSSNANFNEFLYVYIVEKDNDPSQKIDNAFRIVFWPNDDAETVGDGTYVLYGKRLNMNLRKNKKYVPYRLEFSHYTEVIRFLRYTLGNEQLVAVELHHYSGWYDDSLDPYFIDWHQCPTGKRNEIVAFDTVKRGEGNDEDSDGNETFKLVERALGIIQHAIKV
jgi:hypothetical protein